MTRMTGPDCVVMCNLINTHTHMHTHTDFSLNRVGLVAANPDNVFFFFFFFFISLIADGPHITIKKRIAGKQGGGHGVPRA